MTRNIVNKCIAVFMLLFFVTAYGKAQQRQSTTAVKDSLAASLLSSRTGLSYEAAMKVRRIMNDRKTDNAAGGLNSPENRIEHQARIKAAGFERRYKIDSVLNQEERLIWRQAEEKLQNQQNIRDSIMFMRQRIEVLQSGGQLVKQE